jgi:hypothetical protein
MGGEKSPCAKRSHRYEWRRVWMGESPFVLSARGFIREGESSDGASLLQESAHDVPLIPGTPVGGMCPDAWAATRDRKVTGADMSSVNRRTRGSGRVRPVIRDVNVESSGISNSEARGGRRGSGTEFDDRHVSMTLCGVSVLSSLCLLCLGFEKAFSTKKREPFD